MRCTTVQNLRNDFRKYDNNFDFESEITDFQGSSIDDDRAFSNSSDISEITFGNLPSGISSTAAFGINDGRSFSNVSILNEKTLENFISDTSVTTATDKKEVESSDAISEHYAKSMVACLELSRHNDSVAQSFPTKVR